MRAFPSRLLRAFAMLPVVVALVAGPSIADNLDQKVNDASEALTQATRKVAAARKLLADAEAKLPGARAALARANSVEAAAQAAYIVADGHLQEARTAYAAAKSRVDSKQAEIDRLQIKVNQFARSVYQQGQTSQWEIVLEAKSPSDLTSRLQTIRSVSQASQASLGLLDEAKVALKVEADAADQVRATMQGLADVAAKALADAEAAKSEAAKAKGVVDALVRQRADALAVAEKDRTKVKKQYDELRAEQIRLSQQSGQGSRGNGDPQATGPLSWPMPGRSPGGGVGWRVHPVYGYRSCHTGVDTGAPSGTPIRSAGTGVVLSTGKSRAYGNVTLIDHGDGLVTMYAHQSRFGVTRGQTVSDQQVIGYVGSTGYSTGPHLHFEVHINGVPYDPMGWFGGVKRVVPCWGK